MKKLIIVLFLCSISAPKAFPQDAWALIPYVEMLLGTMNDVNKTMEASEEELTQIRKALKTVKDVDKFLEAAIAAREAINNLVCLAESMKEVEIMGILNRLGVPEGNLFSDFMECQYRIYYSTLEIDAHSMNENLKRAMDLDESLTLKERIDLINETIDKIGEIRYRTVNAKGALVEVTRRHILSKKNEKYVRLFMKI